MDNSWKVWGEQIDEAVKAEILNDFGDRDNAHYLPSLAERIMKDVPYIPMWSCVCRDTFGYGREPASSASVESDFNDLKNRVFIGESLPIRADDFLPTHVKYISGRLKLINAPKVAEPSNAPNIIEKTNVNEDGVPIKTREFMDTSWDIQTHSDLSEVSDFPKDFTDACDMTLNFPNIHNATPMPKANSTFCERTKQKPTIIHSQLFGNGCIACANGNAPDGAHKCIFCKKFVHILPGCSERIEGEEEGYGEKRVCISCRKHYPDSVRDNVVSNDRENWMNLGRYPPKMEPKNAQSRPTKNPQKSPVKIVLLSTQKSPPTVLENPLKDIINHLPKSPPKFLSNCPAKRPAVFSLPPIQFSGT